MLNNFTKQLSSKKYLIAAVFIFIIACILMYGKPVGTSGLTSISGQNMLDVSASFSPFDAYNTLDLMGEDGRTFYRNMYYTSDLLFPFAYAFLGATLMALVYRERIEHLSYLSFLVLLPITAGIMDYFENIFILQIILNYPTQLYGIAITANIFHVLKAFILMIAVVLIIIGAVTSKSQDKQI